MSHSIFFCFYNRKFSKKFLSLMKQLSLRKYYFNLKKARGYLEIDHNDIFLVPAYLVPSEKVHRNPCQASNFYFIIINAPFSRPNSRSQAHIWINPGLFSKCRSRALQKKSLTHYCQKY